MAKDDGGPAFPTYSAVGMSLRDYFAAHAADADLWPYLTKFDPEQKISVPAMSREQARYAYADAMLAARLK